MTLSHGTTRARANVIHKKTPNAGGRVWGVSFEIFEAVTNAHASRRMKAWAVDGCYRSSRLRLRRRTGRRLHGADKLAEQLGCAATSGDNLRSRRGTSLVFTGSQSEQGVDSTLWSVGCNSAVACLIDLRT